MRDGKILIVLVFTILTSCKTAHILAPAVQSHHQCDISCTNTDLTLCATNGECIQEFKGECLMSAYNCEHPYKPFVIIEAWKCEQSGATKCT